MPANLTYVAHQLGLAIEYFGSSRISAARDAVGRAKDAVDRIVKADEDARWDAEWAPRNIKKSTEIGRNSNDVCS